MSDVILIFQDFSQCSEQLSEDFELDEITKHLNEYYCNEKAEIDPSIIRMATLSLPKDEWKVRSKKIGFDGVDQ